MAQLYGHGFDGIIFDDYVVEPDLIWTEWKGVYGAGLKEESKQPKKEASMPKYYKVIKDHPIWEAGAVLYLDGGTYQAINELWVKDVKKGDKDSDYIEVDWAIENQPEWFERVYAVESDKKVQYLDKKAAKEATEKQYK